MNVPEGAFDNVNWSDLERENPTLFIQVKPHISRRTGKVTSLPDTNLKSVLAWIEGHCAKKAAAEAAVKAKAEEAARHKAAVEARNARRHAEFMAQHGAEIQRANHYAALARIQQYATERGLAEDPSNATAIAAWCEANGGMSELNVDRAVQVLSPKLIWSSFASKLRS